jgi:hypothetical protein
MFNDFRESKFLNESGSKLGNWYMNRLDYFQYHRYPGYKQQKYGSLLIGVLFYLISLNVLTSTFIGFIVCCYICYLALLTFNILRTQRCRYRGYFLYPTKIILFFRAREVPVNLNDFDSVATMNSK